MAPTPPHPLPAPLLDVRGLDITFPGSQGPIHAVRGLDLTLQRGETLALVGESGCGKSTTALALLQLLAPGARLAGQVLFDGRDLLALPAAGLRQVRGKEIAMIFQEPMTSLNPVHTIGAQIAETLRRHEGIGAAAARQRSIELLDLVRIPEPHRRVDDHPHQLSGGQRQRVMIAMAVACRPRLLVADEPTTALDVTIQAQILELLDGLRREFDMALLLITHDLGLVAQWADRVAVMFAGEKVEEATTQRLFAAPRHAYTRGLLGASLHQGASPHYTQARLPEIRVLPATTAGGPAGFELHQPAPPRHRHAQTPLAVDLRPPLLSVRGLRVAYAARDGGRVAAVDGVDFDIGPGETLGLVGESGCGKSSLSRALLKLTPPTGGQVRFDGTDLVPLSERGLKPWRRRIQMVFQDPYASLNPRRSVGDILDTVLVVHGVGPRAERSRRIAAMLDRVGLPAGSADRYPNEFSGGQRQRIGIARALIVRPELVVLDEPVSALDVSVQAQILNLLAELKEDFGLSYLFVSHDLSVVRYFADRVMVMNRGRIIETGRHDELWDAPREAYTRSLIAAVPRAENRKAA